LDFLDSLFTLVNAFKTTNSTDNKHQPKGACLQMKSALNILMQMKIGSNRMNLLETKTSYRWTKALFLELQLQNPALKIFQAHLTLSRLIRLSFWLVSDCMRFPWQKHNVKSDSLGTHHSNSLSNSTQQSNQSTSSADAHLVSMQSKSSSTSSTSTTRPPACMSFECAFDVSAITYSKG
jgi:hypothetical protein